MLKAATALLREAATGPTWLFKLIETNPPAPVALAAFQVHTKTTPFIVLGSGQCGCRGHKMQKEGSVCHAAGAAPILRHTDRTEKGKDQSCSFRLMLGSHGGGGAGGGARAGCSKNHRLSELPRPWEPEVSVLGDSGSPAPGKATGYQGCCPAGGLTGRQAMQRKPPGPLP